MLYNYFVYIVTNNIQKRIAQHYFDSQNSKKSFAGKYSCYFLVYYQGFEFPKDAINKEKELKKWRSEKKNNLISEFNPKWESLNNQIF